MAKLVEGDGVEVDGGLESQVEEPQTQPGEKPNSSLAAAANDIIGDFFVDHQKRLFDYELSDTGIAALTCFAPKNIKVAIQDREWFHYNLNENISPEDGREFLVALCGDYVKELDFYHDQDVVTNPKLLAKHIPELDQLLGLLTHPTRKTHSYCVALTMDPEYRDLPIVAVHKQMPKPHICESGFNQEVIGAGTPSFQSIVNAAKEYGVKEIKPVLAELSKVKKIYERLIKK